MENNKLVKVNDSLFSKIINVFRGIVWGKNKKDDKAKKQGQTKEEFFEIYNKVKNKQIDLESLDLEALQRISNIQDEEIKLKDDKLQKLKHDLEKYEEERKFLENKKKQTL